MRGDPNRLQEKLGVKFHSMNLLESAFTHPSVRAPNRSNYERLEFLGDAVLDLVISEWLMRENPRFNEGALSQMRAQLVNRETLSAVALILGLDEFVKMGNTQQRSADLRGSRSVLADVLEALIGALYLDQGMDVTRTWIIQLFADYRNTHFKVEDVMDYKSILQEWTQAHGLQLPTYQVIEESGPDHDKTFKIQCELRSGDSAVGDGVSKKQAEQRAAKALVDRLGVNDVQQ